MFCTNCGKQIPNDSVFCEFCGTKIDNAKAADEPVKMQPRPEKQANTEKHILKTINQIRS